MTEKIDLRDDGEAEFSITDPDGDPVTYDALLDYVRDEGDKLANKQFKFKCAKCGSSDCEVEDGLRQGSSWTGTYGSIDLTCKDCKAYRTLYDV